ncbi:MAG: fibronectin type III domain-containing protein [Weeksellaceae bacterium]|nr:fibronectin type III domain-containing protein [Weeksellaceae bacterium]
MFNIGGRTGNVSWQTVGTAPNREIVFQWKDFRPAYSTSATSAYTFNFQIRLQETTGKVMTVYSDGSFAIGSTAQSGTRQIGLRGATNTDFNNRLNATSLAFISSTAGTANSSTQAFNTGTTPPGMPTLGLTYSWMPQACFAPSSISAANFTPSSAQISWLAPSPVPTNGYVVYYSTVNTAPTSATVLDASNSVSGAASPVTVGGLSPSTTYYIWMKSNCSATESSVWVSGGSFKTLCPPVAAPFAESFSSGVLPTCWTSVNPTTVSTNANVFWKFTGVADYGASAANNPRPSGTFAWVDASTPNLGEHTVQLLSPLINLTGLAAPYIQFDWFKNHSSSTSTTPVASPYDNNKLTVEVNNGTGWVTVFTGTSNVPAWRTEGIALPLSYVGSTIQLRFTVDKDVAGNGYFYDDVLLDEVQVMEAPACVMPSSLNFNTVTSTGAQVTWVAPPSAPSGGYDVYVSTTNVAPTSTSTPTFSGVMGNSQTVTGVSGTTYYVWVRSNCGSSQSMWSGPVTFTVSYVAPANDNCAGAVSLTVNPDFLCTAFTAGTTYGATASTETAPSCAVAGTNDDVWFKFTATNALHRVALNNVSASTDVAMAAYSGVCGSLVQVACSDPNIMDLTGLTPGTQYLVRVWTVSATAATGATFEICLGTPPPPPANDDCVNAISLVPSSTGTCTTPVSGSTASASASTGTAPTCSATGINDDVWYSFTATSTTHLVNVTYSDNATATQVYSGTCGSLTALACNSTAYGNSNVLLSTLTVGQTYYVRVYSAVATAATTSNFQICITTPVIPTNDTCATAIAIAPNGTVSGNNALATADTLPASTCGSASPTATYNGVWYTVTSQVSGPVTISACGTQFDAYLRVYTGDCTTLTCVANTSGVGYADAGCPGNNNAPTLTFNATAGTTYYVYLSSYAVTDMGSFTITTSGTLGTSNVIAETEKVSVYPNPFTDMVNISNVKDLKSVSVVDMSGRLVKTIANPGRQINLSELKAGLYILKLDYKDGTVKTVKAIKK